MAKTTKKKDMDTLEITEVSEITREENESIISSLQSIIAENQAFLDVRLSYRGILDAS